MVNFRNQSGLRCAALGAMLFTQFPWDGLLADGRLEHARAEVREKGDDGPKNSGGSSSDNEWDGGGYGCDEKGSFLESLWNESGGPWLVLAGVTAPWWGPRQLLQDDGAPVRFGHFPYADDWPGFLVDELPAPEWTKPWAVRFASEGGTDFYGLRKYGGRLRLDSTSRFGIDTEWNRRSEDVAGGHDSLWMGDVNVVYRFAQSPQAAFYTGLGVNWLSDSRGGNAGFNFTYGVDVFPCKPWVISGVIDWGRLGDASLFHGRATVGVLLDRCEFFTGYDHLNLEGASLPSWVSGLQIWF